MDRAFQQHKLNLMIVGKLFYSTQFFYDKNTELTWYWDTIPEISEKLVTETLLTFTILFIWSSYFV